MVVREHHIGPGAKLAGAGARWNVDVQCEGEMRDKEELVKTLTDRRKGEQHHERVRNTSADAQYPPFFAEDALSAAKEAYEYRYGKRMNLVQT